MIFTETKLKGSFIIDLERRNDSRGFFARGFCQKEFEAHGLKPIIAQANIASNSKKERSGACIFSTRHAPKPSSSVVRGARYSMLSLTCVPRAKPTWIMCQLN